MESIIQALKGKTENVSTYVVCKQDPRCSVDSLMEHINADFPPKEKEKNFNVVYVYLLSDATFEYPTGKSSVLYIGRCEGEKYKDKKNLGYRFKHCKEGKDSKRNICLWRYYEKGAVLTLKIFDLKRDFSNATVEKELRYAFLEKHHALPIADGASYKK